MSNVHRKHPVSIAVSLALLAAAATSVIASEPAAAPPDNAGAQGPAPQDVPTTPSPAGRKPKPGTDSGATDQGPPEKSQLETITIIGVRQSQERAIEVKLKAPSIQDSISAENIGQLPDTTITDALQRITGVQINRDAGVGTSVDVRGLPQVGTM
ncbi:MAG TPA: TonB-dependent receptor plug domain-containing protein, partial [Steroidobacteraceae bacterium]|nr:TonB-dependent receptor plug domain-containing protein [Steroidobacteraceae bacterium]